MKIVKSIALVLSIGICAACISCVGILVPIKGNGKLISSQRTLSSFDEIRVYGSAEVRFHVSGEYGARVTVDSNLEEYIRVNTRDNVLYIGNKGSYLFTNYFVDVYAPDVSSISISGAGSFSNSDTININRFNSEVSGSGTINGRINCDYFSAKISGSGNIDMSGKCNVSSIGISGSGDFRGKELSANIADIRIGGSGNADVYVTETLTGTISGSGDIYYRGAPDIEVTVNGSGKIIKR